VQEQAQKDAARELSELTPRIPKLVITMEGARPDEVTLTVDGKPLARALLGEEQPMNPGSHTIRGARPAEAVEQPITLLEGPSPRRVRRFQTRAAPVAPAAQPVPAAVPVAPPAAAPDASTGHASGSGNKTLAYLQASVDLRS